MKNALVAQKTEPQLYTMKEGLHQIKSDFMEKEGAHDTGVWKKKSLDERGRNPVFGVAETLACGGKPWQVSAMFHEYHISLESSGEAWDSSIPGLRVSNPEQFQLYTGKPLPTRLVRHERSRV